MINIEDENSLPTDDGGSTTMASSRSGVAPGTRSQSATGCEDTTSNRMNTPRLNFAETIRIWVNNKDGLLI